MEKLYITKNYFLGCYYVAVCDWSWAQGLKSTKLSS